MASRNSGRGNAARTPHDAEIPQVQEAAGQASRQQLTLLTQTTASVLHNAAALQEAQLQLLRRSGAIFQEAATKMQQATQPADLLTIQSEVVMAGWQEAVQFSQSLLRLGANLAPEVGAAAGKPPDTVAPGLEAVAPMVQAWQSLFTPPSNGGGRSRTTH